MERSVWKLRARVGWEAGFADCIEGRTVAKMNVSSEMCMSDSTPVSANNAREPLHRLAKPQPKPLGMPVADEPGSGSATGFVSTLAAKRTFDSSDTLSELARRSKEQLQMAREIPPARAKVVAPRRVAVPTWYRVALPVSLILAVMLVGIGVWAVGALVYMKQVMPIAARDVHYPLIVWS